MYNQDSVLHSQWISVHKSRETEKEEEREK